MKESRWGDPKLGIPTITKKGNEILSFRNVEDIIYYTELLGLPVYEYLDIEKFYSPKKDEYYANTKPSDVRAHVKHTAHIIFVRGTDVEHKKVHVAGIKQLQLDYLVANEHEDNGIIRPYGYRISDIQFYQPVPLHKK